MIKFRVLLAAALTLLPLAAFGAQTIPLPAGSTSATSVTVTCTTSGTLSEFSTVNALPTSVNISVFRLANGQPILMGYLNGNTPTFNMTPYCPGQFYETRPAVPSWSLGVSSDLSTSSGTVTLAPTGQTPMAGAVSVAIANDQTPVPISASSLPLPTGAATAGKQDITHTDLAAINTTLGTPFQAGGTVTANLGTIGTAATAAGVAAVNTTLGTPMQNSGGSVTANAGTNLNTSALALETGGHLATIDSTAGAVGDTACATDNGSCSLEALIKRLNQRLTTLNTTLGSPFQASASIGNTGFNVTPATSGGLTSIRLSVTNTAAAVDASPGQEYGYYIYNPNASVCYLQWFNVTSGSVTVGTTAPTMGTWGIPPSGAANLSRAIGVAYSTAITVAAATTPTGGTACGSNLEATIYFK